MTGDEQERPPPLQASSVTGRMAISLVEFFGCSVGMWVALTVNQPVRLELWWMGRFQTHSQLSLLSHNRPVWPRGDDVPLRGCGRRRPARSSHPTNYGQPSEKTAPNDDERYRDQTKFSTTSHCYRIGKLTAFHSKETAVRGCDEVAARYRKRVG